MMMLRSVLVSVLATSVLSYEEPKIGPCRGPGGVNDKVNSRSATEHTKEMCETACTDLPACVGYAYCESCNNGECILYGPGVDGECSDSSAKSPTACSALGSCPSMPDVTLEDACGTCSETTAKSKVACGTVSGTWTAAKWESANAVWSDADDPWSGDSHHSTIIAGTTEETSSKFVCVDAEPEDHMAHCKGDGTACTFEGVAESDRTDEKCPDTCTFVPEPKPPKNKPPHVGDIGLPGWDKAMSGACRGGEDFTDKVNGKYSNTAGKDGGTLTQTECADACLAEKDCIGYAHGAAWCIVYGPGIHETADGDKWTADNHDATEISGTKVNPSYICVTGPPHGGVTSDGTLPSYGLQAFFSLAALWGLVYAF